MLNRELRSLEPVASPFMAYGGGGRLRFGGRTAEPGFLMDGGVSVCTGV